MTQQESLQGRRILVIEDDYMLAEDLSAILEQAGIVVLGPIGHADEAVAFISDDTLRLDGVVLDVNLHGHTSYPIADALIDRGVPFVFVTGYDGDALASAYRGHPRCGKPFRAHTVLAALASTQA